jgi:superfamily II DNA helicase RecQ
VRKAGIWLAREIKDCTKWQAVCVDPEHLRDKEWREISESPVFQANVLFTCINEVHLINEWGLSFRLALAGIGTFLWGCFPASICIVGLSAMLEAGLPTVSVCKSLGFFEGHFRLIQRSNEYPNTQFIIPFLTCGLNGDKFSDLLPYLASGRKTIIHCRTVNQVSHVYAYIWHLQPDGVNKLNRARVYHSICPPDYNKETIRLLETDPYLQIVISTVAFSNGINAKSLLDSLSLGFGSTFNESWQEKGRVGRNPDTIGRGVIFSHRKVIKDTQLYLTCMFQSFYINENINPRQLTVEKKVLNFCLIGPNKKRRFRPI